MKSEDIITVYLTFADRAEAERIGHVLVSEQLVACINIMAPMTSMYPWQGVIQQNDEVPALAKSVASRFDALVARVTELHSYDTPCIVAWPLSQVAEKYGEWVQKVIG